jgi:ElaB/YqjD/DUF883 family membrane-anchored ribosome-binding protein
MSQNNPSGQNTPTGGTGTGATHTPTSGAGTGGSTASTTRDSSPSSGQNLAQSRAGQSGSGGGTGTATALAQEYGQKIADAAGTAKDYVSEKVSVVGDKIKDLQNVDINEVANQAKDYARQNPGQAILISAAAGFVLGLLLRGSRR